MRYEEYNVEDFLFDEFFVRWIKNPGPETEHFWETWMEKNPQKMDTINKAREIVLSINYKNKYHPTDQEYDEVLENILRQRASFTQFEELKKSDRLAFIVKLAAVLFILSGVSAMIMYMNTSTNLSKQSTQMIEKEIPYGQKLTFALDDGTIVKLNAGSKLTYPEKFIDSERKVYLEGEAFFEVKKDASRPFIVETRNLITTVTGTSFNVKSYWDEDDASVAVASGNVIVMKKDSGVAEPLQQYALGEDQMAIYDAGNNSIITKEHITDDVFAWKDNTIYFEDSDFDYIITTLTRWYGVEFVLPEGKSFDGRLHNIRYANGESLDNILEGLKDEYSFTYIPRDNGKKIYIY